MPRKSIPMDYTKEEAKQRFDAALRGARITGHKPMSEIKRNLRKPATKPTKAKIKPGR